MNGTKENERDEYYLAKWLDKSMSDEEFKEKVSPEAYASYVKIRDGISVYELLNTPIDNSFLKIKAQINQKKVKKLPLLRYVAIAASIILCFSLYIIFQNDTIVINAAIAQQENVVLLDGSQVIVNANSTLIYEEKDWKHNRELSLEGEAYFEVKNGSQFTVKTTNGTVNVLGTKFNVKTRQDFLEVTCYEGKVKVSYGNESKILTALQSIQKIDGNLLKVQQLPHDILAPAWFQNESRYNSVPLRYVLLDLESQYNITIDKINIDDTLIFTGSFTHTNKRLALQSVFQAFNIKYSEKNKGKIELYMH
ncbi:FecR family protein [uncultured Kordia sp.]|uniref:FecR family protein n=1 Tax=uncultured Kordia sp. TaxID=507699 RepID=UPI00260D2DA4|nr:FecR family protein [uncultured Kordia sp.]